MSEDNPIAVAARAIKDLHQQNIDLIDGGHVFMRDGVDVSEQMRIASLDQMSLCDTIIDASPQLMLTSEKNKMALGDILHELEEIKSKRADVTAELPEIGNYGHQETE